jgi:DNA (cytosine-5)-methyltransferase 1
MLAIDLCAGIGWSVACSQLGIVEHGVEIMPEAIATRSALGAVTINQSIAELPDSVCAGYDLQIAGPPCQTFSAAGKGEGRKALDEVLRRVALFAKTGEFIRGGSGDPRTWLVLEPLRLAVHGLPAYIVWEQVPSVLPVWVACGEVLKSVGYSVWTGYLYSEQYGVPQTRKRAFLIARRDGIQAAPPMPTHSRYHNRAPERMDTGVLPWVSMAEALSWGTHNRPSPTVTGGGTSGVESIAHYQRLIDSQPDWVMRYNYGTGGDPQARGERTPEQPAPTITSKIDRNFWTYTSSTMPNATERPETAPAPTVAFGNDANSVRWVYRNGTHDHAAMRPVSAPAPTIMFGARSNTVEWVHERPSTTVQGDPRIASAGHHERQMDNSIRVTVEEAAILQTFPYPELIQGKSGKRYLQVGNMVPPLLGKAILSTFLQETT